MEEIEFVISNINIKDIETRLKKIGAEKEKEITYKIIIFDYPDLRLDKEGAWIRLRDNGEKIKLAFKQRLGINKGKTKREDLGMKEIEFEVPEIEKVKEFMLSIGLTVKFTQEKKRIRWKKDDIIFDIDIWPKLDPYLEIESSSEEKIDKAIEELGLDPSKKKRINNYELYKEKGIDIKDYKEMTFDRWIKK